MPPLELSRKNNGSFIDRSDTPEEEGYLAGSSDARDNTHFLQDSSSIQTMLKNTIETGDVGQFSINPSQLPVPSQRATRLSSSTALNRPSRIPSTRSYTRRFVDNDVDLHQSSSYPYPSSPGSSSVVSFHQTHSPPSYRAPSQGSNQDDRSYSMSQSSVINHGLSNHGLHPTSRLLVQGDARDLRPRSPFAYPTRLKRPGYRPSSPALSELHKDNQGASAGGHRAADISSASPMYTYALRKAPLAWQQGFTHPDSLFQRHPPPPASRYGSARSSSPSYQRRPTPGPFLSLDQNSSVSPGLLDPSSDKSGWTTRQSPSPSPVFYDYSEAFEEETHFRKPVVTLAGEAPSENVDVVYQELEGSSRGASINEISTYSEAPKARLKEIAANVGAFEPASSVNRRASSQIPRRVLGSNHSSVVEVDSAEKGNIAIAGGYQLPRKAKSFVVERPRASGRHGVPTVSSKHYKIQRRTYAGLSAVRSKSRVSLASPAGSTSSSESMCSRQSSSRPKPPIQDSPTEHLSEIDRHPERLENPPFNSDRPTSGLENEDQILLPPPTHPASFDYWSDSEPSQIYAPTPERSLSSPRHRDRFSRIFSIGEGSVNPDEVDKNPGRASRNRVAERHIKEEELGNSETTNASVFGTESSLKDPPKVALEMRRPAIDMNFHDVLEKSQAPEEELSKSPDTNSEGQQLTETRPEQMTIASKASEASFSPRICREKEPAVSLLVSPSQVPSVDVIRLDDPVRKSDPVRISPAERDNKKPNVIAKRLPSLPSILSFTSYSPPLEPTPDTLPFSFKPLVVDKIDRASIADLRNYDGEASNKEQDEDDKVEKHFISQCNLREPHNSDSTESLPSLRPWNLDTSYPWTDQPPELEMAMPQPGTDLLQSTNKPPRFKLKVHRASSSMTGSGKLTKQLPTLDLSAIRKRDMPSEISQTGQYPCKPRTSITISQSNSSHVSQVATQYSDNLNSPLASSTVSPSIKLVPPSPGLNLEVRSFFSDDSSQVQPKGSLRKRISQLKLIAARANSTEDFADNERGGLGSAKSRSRASGHTSKQDASTSERMYNLRHLRWRIVEKVRSWFHRGEEKIRWWGGKMTAKVLKGNSPSTEINSGV
ncbi:hypothetical protein MMC07_003841 [Pseudocyphellaria aurata]|nr:hypothetical protein [Pseudocyphellaria aurata]